jgi:hypothetical protein
LASRLPSSQTLSSGSLGSGTPWIRSEVPRRATNSLTAAGGDRAALTVQHVLEMPEPNTSADRYHAVLDRHGIHARHVEDQALLTLWRNKLRASEDPERIFNAVEPSAPRGQMSGRSSPIARKPKHMIRSQ